MKKARKDVGGCICLDVFNQHRTMVVFTDNVEKSFKNYEHTKNLEAKENSEAVTVFVKGENTTMVFFPFGPSPGLVAHEMWHVVRNQFEILGVSLDHESVAYTLNYLVDEAAKISRFAWWKPAKKGKKKS